MFQQRRQSAMGNVNLGNLSGPPGEGDLGFVLEQAQRHRGRFVELTWTVPKTGATFQVTAKFVPGQPEPAWMLYRGPAGTTELVWGHYSNDLTLVHNLIMLECEKPLDGGNNISSAAMDGVVSATRASGGLANSPGGGNPATPSAGGGGGQSGATPRNQREVAGAWLQNLAHLETSGASAATAAQATATPMAATGQGGPSVAAMNVSAPSAATMGGIDDRLLDGSLANITMPNLLRYLANNGATGRLSVHGSISAAEIFFRGGAVVDAAALESVGELALLDAVAWTDGEFHFEADMQTAKTNINTPMPELIGRCDRMFESSRFLQEQGLRVSLFLIPTQQVNRSQLEQKLLNYNLSDAARVWRFFEHLDGNRTLFDVLRLQPMTRGEWIPIVAALLHSGTVSLSERPIENKPGIFLEGAPIDESAIVRFMQSMCGQLSRVMKPDPFLFLLQQEHFRFERTGSSYALVLFSFATTNMLNGNLVPFDSTQMAEATHRISLAKRKLDVVGQLEDGEFALLLPETDAAGAEVFANRITRALRKTPTIVEETAEQQLVVSFGLASVPHDVRDLPALIAAARAAKSRSKLMGASVCSYGQT